MASHFSGVLKLTDLDDFITPSQVFDIYYMTPDYIEMFLSTFSAIAMIF